MTSQTQSQSPDGLEGGLVVIVVRHQQGDGNASSPRIRQPATATAYRLPTGSFDFVVRALYEDDRWVGQELVDVAAFDAHLPGQLDTRICADADDNAIRTAAAAAFPAARCSIGSHIRRWMSTSGKPVRGCAERYATRSGRRSPGCRRRTCLGLRCRRTSRRPRRSARRCTRSGRGPGTSFDRSPGSPEPPGGSGPTAGDEVAEHPGARGEAVKEQQCRVGRVPGLPIEDVEAIDPHRAVLGGRSLG